MGQATKIEWCDHTFNPWWGCIRVSPGCEHCYAETFAKRTGHDVWGPAKTTGRRMLSESYWRGPEKWNAKAAADGVRRRVFCASMADVFEDHPALPEPRARLFDLIEDTPHLDWLLLTKRPENMNRMAPLRWAGRWPANVWAGCSVEDQKRADERLPHLLGVPARIRFLSCEPLVGPVEFSDVTHRSDCVSVWGKPALAGIHWVIVGGESGPGARSMDVAWARSIVAQCRGAGVAPFVKQLGARPHDSKDQDGRCDCPQWTERCEAPGHATGWMRLRDPKGGDWNEWPANLRVREWPA